MAGKPKDLTGDRYGRLVALSLDHIRPSGGAVWRCRCDCGQETLATSNHLRTGTTKSCGCLNRERRIENCLSRSTHGHAPRRSQSKTYIAWCNMHRRCAPTSPDAEHYFERGIGVCERWATFENFLADMGEAPKGATLDRRDNDAGYEPGNCHWVGWTAQQNNRRTNRILVIRGERLTMRQAADKYGLNYNTLRSRIYILGQDAEQAVGLVSRLPIEEAEELSETERGSGGFGSTGR